MKNKRVGIIAILLALALFSFSGCNNDPDVDYPENGHDTTLSPTEGTPALLLVSYELAVGDIFLSVPEYNFYFIELMYDAYERYLNMFWMEPFDPDLPLEEQMFFDGEITWAEYIHALVVENIKQYARARELGMVLSQEDILQLVEFEAMIHEIAAMHGYERADDLLSADFEGLTVEMFMQFMERNVIINNWRSDVLSEITFTDEELEEFFYANWLDIDPSSLGERNMDAFVVDARHILAMLPSHPVPSSAEEIAATRLIAEEIYAEWQNGPATEETFAALAEARTDDHGSIETGGLYTNIMRRSMVPEFDEWIFDPSRSTGDTAIVETEFGFHIMYFVQVSMTEWEIATREFMTSAIVFEIIDELSERFDAERRPA